MFINAHSTGNFLASVSITKMIYDSADAISSFNVDAAVDSAVSTAIETL